MRLYLILMTTYVIAMGAVVYMAAPVVSGYMEKFDRVYWEALR